MRQTKSGRWVPDRPKPEPKPPAPDLSYDGYLVHVYTHREAREGCAWCGELPSPPMDWELVRSVKLRKK